MFVVHSLPLAIFFCIITMLGWGSWANTQKLTGKERWPFQLFYWDYAIGVLLCSLLFAITLGSSGASGVAALANLSDVKTSFVWAALLSGIIFNLSNILLVVGIDAVGMAIAFPIGVGLALVLGTVFSFIQSPQGTPSLLFSGLALIIFAMVMSTVAHRRLPHAQAQVQKTASPLFGILASVGAGVVQGFFYPQLMRSISPAFSSSPIVPGMLTPYVALVFFALGIFVSNFLWNTIFMKMGKVTYADYFRGSFRLHSIGILGGIIWMIALSFNVVASSVAGPAVSYALGQGATLIAALWGLLVWREFKDAPGGTGKYIALMLGGYTVGLACIGAASA
jgi:glucose uptake protein